MEVIGYFGIGSNIGNREENLIKALEYIAKKYKIIELSSLYNTEAVGFTDQDDFLNMVVKVDTTGEDPFKILSYIKSTEKIMGRKDTVRWGPRIIDIDILYIEGVYLRTETLNIPHISLLRRDFVLIPLSELVRYLKIEGKLFDIMDYITNKVKVELYKVREKIKL